MTVYQEKSSLPSDAQNMVDDTLAADEQFNIAVREEKLLKQLSPYYILTNRRLIRYRKHLLGLSETVSDTPLNLVSRVNWNEENLGKSGDLELRGPELHESVTLLGGDGRALAEALRTQVANQKQPA